MDSKRRMYPKAHYEDDGIIEITMERTPRWKESELSGDEWRFSLRGVIVLKDWKHGGIRQVAVAGGRWSLIEVADLVAAWLHQNRDDLMPPFSITDPSELRCCFQPGCADWPEVLYGIKQEWTWFPHQGRRMESESGGPSVRAFCGKHRHRGDCDLEDADKNYYEIAYPMVPVEVEEVG